MNEQHQANAQQVHELLQSWAGATRAGKLDEILQHHHPDARIFDVLPPLLYQGTDAYRASWASWQPDTGGGVDFDLSDVEVVAGDEVAFASALIHCGGTLKNGRSFKDLVRATFGLQKLGGRWTVMHQHTSKPMGA